MKSTIHIISGTRNAGKTSLVMAIIAWAQDNGISTRGIISTGNFNKEGHKLGFTIKDVATGHEMDLAVRDNGSSSEIKTAAYSFNKKGLSWGRKLIEKATPCDILIIDEIGPLEFEGQKGWSNAFKVVRTGEFGCAIVVIREELVDHAIKLWPEAMIWKIKCIREITKILKGMLKSIRCNVQDWRRTNRK